MSHQEIAAALQRVQAVLQRRPETGVHDDAPATAHWQRGTRVITSHANGTQIATDMPTELGGSGDKVTPGWLFRAGLAACAATSIELTAAARGIDLTLLEVQATSSSDLRGLMGMSDGLGRPVAAGPFDMRLHVRIGANGVDGALLRALVEDGLRCSPIPNAVSHATPFSVRIEHQTAVAGAA